MRGSHGSSRGLSRMHVATLLPACLQYLPASLPSCLPAFLPSCLPSSDYPGTRDVQRVARHGKLAAVAKCRLSLSLRLRLCLCLLEP